MEKITHQKMSVLIFFITWAMSLDEQETDGDADGSG